MSRYGPRRLIRRLGCALALLRAVLLPAEAEADPCGVAIESAAKLTGVPVSLLRAIGEVESGVQVSDKRFSWPWAVNDGRSLFFRSREAAAAHIQTLVAAGKTNVDVGCMQVNWRWHAEALEAPAELLDPMTNALYAARYLSGLRKELGSCPGGEWLATVEAELRVDREVTGPRVHPRAQQRGGYFL